MQRFSPVQQIFSIRTQPPQNESVLYTISLPRPPFSPSLSSLNTFVSRFAGCGTVTVQTLFVNDKLPLNLSDTKKKTNTPPSPLNNKNANFVWV